MSEKFTKGPYDRDGASVFALEDRGDTLDGKPLLVNRFYARVYGAGEGSATPEECEAVAALFQASPDLYEALNRVIAAIALDTEEDAIEIAKALGCEDPSNIIDVCIMARAALARARGEA